MVKKVYTCSFCSGKDTEVRFMVQGVYTPDAIICDNCIHEWYRHLERIRRPLIEVGEFLEKMANIRARNTVINN